MDVGSSTETIYQILGYVKKTSGKHFSITDPQISNNPWEHTQLTSTIHLKHGTPIPLILIYIYRIRKHKNGSNTTRQSHQEPHFYIIYAQKSHTKTKSRKRTIIRSITKSTIITYQPESFPTTKRQIFWQPTRQISYDTINKISNNTLL